MPEDINSLNMRVTLLEEQHLRSSDVIKNHDNDIHQLIAEVRNAANGLSLLSTHISTGIRVLCTGAAAIVVLVGGFWTYQLNQDARHSASTARR